MIWPFRRNEARAFLWRKFAETQTRDGRIIVQDAILASYRFPGLSGPELIRLVYWGASGSAPE